jgi:hypothetical protein
MFSGYLKPLLRSGPSSVGVGKQWSFTCTAAGIAQWYGARLTGLMIGGSSPSKGWEFFSSPPRPDRPPIQWVAGALSLRVKRPRREVNYASQYSAEIRNA